jgi:hypothetical protein
MNGSKIKNRVGTAIIIGIFGSMVLSLYCTIQQQAYAVAAAEIQEKYLTDAHNALQSGNTTGAIRDILAILDWEFNEVHPNHFWAMLRQADSWKMTAGY